MALIISFFSIPYQDKDKTLKILRLFTGIHKDINTNTEKYYPKNFKDKRVINFFFLQETKKDSKYEEEKGNLDLIT